MVGKAEPLSYDRLLAEASSLDPPMSKDDMAFWLYSSGAPDFPKGRCTCTTICSTSAIWSASRLCRSPKADNAPSQRRNCFAYGLNIISIPMRFGASGVLLPDRPTRRRCSTPSPTTHPAFSTASHALRPDVASGGRAVRYDLSTLRLCVSLANRCRRIFRRWHDRFGLEICDMIGSTEALHVFVGTTLGMCASGVRVRCYPV